MARAAFLLCCLLAIGCFGPTFGRKLSPPRRTLQAITTSDICRKPQEVAITVAQVLVNGTGLAGADSTVRLVCMDCMEAITNCPCSGDTSDL